MEKIEFENKLLEAIKKDDLKSFSLLMPTNADLNLCYGRFPILSLLYLYSSFKILSKFEKFLLPIHNFRVVEERNEIYKKFKTRAKKSIRLFFDGEIIYPALMLGVLNEKTILKHNFKFLYKNAEIVEKLKKIYKIRYYFEIDVKPDSVKIPVSKITRKQTLLFSIVSFICCLFISLSAIAVGFIKNNSGLGTDKHPIKISTKQELLTALKFGSRTYSIQEDIEVDGSEFVNENFSGTILGNNHTVAVVGEISSSLIKDLSGKVENLNVKLLDTDLKIAQNHGIIAENSSGNIEKVKISGKISGDFSGTEDIFSGFIVSKNTGEITNSEIEVSASLKNLNQTNVYFGAIAGINEGKILDCLVKPGIVSADTVDIAGVAGQNYGDIERCENKMTLIQTSNKEWHPNIGGITIANYGKILDSKNHAELNATSQTERTETNKDNKYYVFVGGIACENYGEIKNARNFGSICANGKIANIISGGLVAQNIDDDAKLAGTIESSLSKSNLTVFSENGQVCVGGVSGLNATSITSSGFIGTIDADSSATENKEVFVTKVERFSNVYAGGVVGINQYSEIKNCWADVNYKANGETIVPVEEDEPLKLYAGIVGHVGIYLYDDLNTEYQSSSICFNYLSKNYYVEKTEIANPAYGLMAFGNFYYNALFELQFEYVSGVLGAIDSSVLLENNTIFIKCDNLQDIPLEVIYE